MKLTSRLAALGLATALLGGPALAQQAQAPAAQAQHSPAHLAAAREVALNSGIARTFEVMAPQMLAQLRQSVQNRPDTHKDFDQGVQALAPEMELQKQRMINATARVFANHLSEAELKEIGAFFKSPAGAKYVETQPKVLDDLVKEMEGWTKELSEYIMIRVRAEMAKRGHHL